MKLFAYYALHTFKNQVKKLFKSWVLIFIVACMLIGGLIGFGAAKLEEAVETGQEEQQVEVVEEPREEEESPSLLETLGVDSADLTELIASAVLLGLLLFEVLTADKSAGRIFLPADVSLLFASPLEPQSVLMFRVATQMGTGLLAGLYMLFQLPNLTLNAGLSLGAALSLVGAWCLALLLGKLLQILCYLLSSAHPALKQALPRGVYALLAVAGVAFGIFWKTGDLGLAPAAAAFFNSPAARAVPVWGWIKGFIRAAMEGGGPALLLWLALCLAGGAGLVLLIRRVKADFYEDAMARSEETAELQEQMRSERSSGLVMRKRAKDRSEKLRRDDFDRGWGASVFFHKAMYNRFRFAHLGFLTKTTETYVALAVLLGLACRFFFETDSVLPVALLLAGLSFFRSLGNPLETDTKMDFFRLIPESMWAKLFWSLLGGGANCLLDSVPALVLGWLAQGVLPVSVDGLLTGLALVLLILSVDLYATIVGTFIDLSVPANAGKSLKQMVQIMFIYFGLLPDIAILAVGIATDHTAMAVAGSALLNLALALVFFSLAPLFLLPRSRKPISGVEGVDLKQARSRFSRLGLGAFTYLAVTIALQLLLGWLASRSLAASGQPAPAWLVWALTFGPQYLVGLPLALLILRGVPAAKTEKTSLGAGRYLSLLPICVFLMYAGSLLANLINALLGALLPVSTANPLNVLAGEGSLPFRILITALLTPAVEELVFRKGLIDRMRPYGEKLAVATSAVMFALFHGNLSQVFYALALGAAFGYVYLKTGKLRYSMGLHVFVNMLGLVVGPTLAERADLAALNAGDLSALSHPGTVALFCYLAAILVSAVAGLVLLCVKRRGVSFDQAPQELPRRGRAALVWGNPGMILFLLGCLGMFLYSLLS